MTIDEKKQALEQSAARLIALQPALRGVVEPFAALAAKRAEIREFLAAREAYAGAPSVDPLSGGPLLEAGHLPAVAAAFAQSAGMMLAALRETFPNTAEDADVLEKALARGDVDPEECVAAVWLENQEAVERLAATLGTASESLVFLLTQALRPSMEAAAEVFGDRVHQEGWFKSFCPVCGMEPEMGSLREVHDDSEYLVSKGGRLMLRCRLCSYEWRHPRVKCPDCGADLQKDNPYYQSPDDPTQRIYACPECKAYYPCLDLSDSLDSVDPDLARIGFLPFEMRIREMGFHPLAEGEIRLE